MLYLGKYYVHVFILYEIKFERYTCVFSVSKFRSKLYSL